MRVLILLFLFFSFSGPAIYGQYLAKSPQQLIQERQSSGAVFQPLTPFKKEKSKDRFEVFNLTKSAYKSLNQGIKNIAIEISTEEFGEITLLVSKVQLFDPNFTFTTSDGKVSKPQDFQTYKGVIKGRESNSVVTLTIRKTYLRAAISIDNERLVFGNYNNQSGKYALVNEKLLENPSFTCDWDESYVEKEIEANPYPSPNRGVNALTSPVSIYFETDYNLYQKLGSTTTAVENYLVSMFNELSTVYASIEVPFVFASSFIWTTSDIYSGSSTTSEMLSTLKSNRTAIAADLIHLLSGKRLGGIAYLNALCGTNRYGVSASQGGDPSTLPKSSFTLIVVAHEIGHNLGSHHTHNCVWNGDNTRIDNCGGEAGYTEGTCSNSSEPLLPERGTIMSYCHLVGGVGSYYEFHEQVAARINSYVSSATCLACDETQPSLFCSTAISLTKNGTYEAIGPGCGNGCYNCNGATHANWYTFTPTENGKITVASCNQGVDTRIFIYSGNCGSLVELANNDDECALSPTSSYNYASKIDTITVEKNVTYYLEWDNKWSSAAFQFDFEFVADPAEPVSASDCTQETKAYNQNSIGDSIFGNHRNITASNTIIRNDQNIMFVASNSITLGPGFQVEAGGTFSAKIENCTPSSSELSEIKINSNNEEVFRDLKREEATFSIYPNPFNQDISIEFLSPIDGTVKIFVYNLQGNMVTVPIEMEVYRNNLLKKSLPLDNLKSGMYFVSINTGTKVYNRKIIKVQ